MGLKKYQNDDFARIPLQIDQVILTLIWVILPPLNPPILCFFSLNNSEMVKAVTLAFYCISNILL